MRKRKLVLKCGLSPGDIVMLTAALRDLHHWYPGRFLTDVKTLCPDLWENNPYITPLPETDADVELLDCSYPLIDRCNEVPYHCLHGFIEFFNERLRLAIKPTVFKGDIHLSALEKSWASQVHEHTGQDVPFWIIAAGGKYDVTIKWWESRRYQEVVDHFRGRIQFVQIGDYGHHHPKLNGVIDLRGETSLRQLIRLAHHSQGVLCSVTALMHLAAAVETKKGRPANRACVVIAGGREPAHWEAYPGHQFIHTNDALPCCSSGGCWKDRIAPLRDGNNRDRRGHLCVDVVHGIPHCMDMITPAEVIRRIEIYFQGGVNEYLTPHERVAAERGVAASSSNPYDLQPLNLSSAGMACDRFIETIPVCPPGFAGRGIVICGGGVGYFTNAWVCINMLRHFGCKLPIELWYLDSKEMDAEMEALVAPLGVKCINAAKVRKQHPVRFLNGWELKPFAILHSAFREILFLDADNVPVANPEYLFHTSEFQKTGAIFWPDYGGRIAKKALPIWKSCGLRVPKDREFETGQVIVDKQRCWRALRLCLWFNENSDFYYQYLYGDKETFHLAFRKLRQPYSLVSAPISSLEKTMCQHDFDGKRIFQHRNRDKWDLFLRNRRIKDFWFEDICRQYLARLQKVWSGRMSSSPKIKNASSPQRRVRSPKIEALMLSHARREALRRETLSNFAGTDWGGMPLHLHIGEDNGEDSEEKQARHAYLGLKGSLKRGADYILLLDDAMDFNRRIRHNLQQWLPLRSGSVTLAGLYNPKTRDLACDIKNNTRIVDPYSILAGPAFLISREMVQYLVRHWNKLEGAPEIRISRLAARRKLPVFYHSPSLAQPFAGPDSAGKKPLPAKDFDADWVARPAT